MEREDLQRAKETTEILLSLVLQHASRLPLLANVQASRETLLAQHWVSGNLPVTTCTSAAPTALNSRPSAHVASMLGRCNCQAGVTWLVSITFC